MNGRGLARLLRLRQVQHDLAKADLVRAHGHRGLAEAESVRRTQALTELRLPDREEGAVWLAVVAARQSAALAIRDSAEVLRLAHSEVDDATAAWARTRAAARGLERIEERHELAAQARRDAVEQREQDDRSAARAHVREEQP